MAKGETLCRDCRQERLGPTIAEEGAARGETLCWDCRQGPRSGCSWFAEHRPVPGWTAERRDVAVTAIPDGRRDTRLEESYLVRRCPLYRRDRPRRRRTVPEAAGTRGAGETDRGERV